MNIKELQALRRKEKEIEDKHQKDLDKMQAELDGMRQAAAEQEKRHQRQCYEIMETIRGKYRFSAEAFTWRDSFSPNDVTVSQHQVNYSCPRLRHWNYKVDMNYLNMIDSKQILEMFLDTICDDIRHQWSRRV